VAGGRTTPAGRPPDPLGIGRCRECPYLTVGTSEICYRCARQTIEPLAPAERRCVTCDLELDETGVCGNPICSWSLKQRFFQWNYAIAMRSGVLQKAINDFKYNNKWGWRDIFARVLVGFLDDAWKTFESFDLIVASPTYLEPRGDRRYDHTRDVIRAADAEADGRWNFDTEDPPAVIKTAATPRFVEKTWQQRRQIAESELRAALHVPNPGATEGRAVLVYDDVFTDGFTLREVARCLRQEGRASVVCGVSLTRQPWNH
jgi:predicted amidophosphoribosyltransferase